MKKETSKKGKIAKQSDTPPENAIKDQKVFWTTKKVETCVAILLGITTLLSAWASWIGSLHSGIQSINFTKSNNMASAGTAEYNSCLQLYIADCMTWTTLSDYYYDLEIAKADGDESKIKFLTEKINNFISQGASDTLTEAVKWMDENGKSNPFEMPGIKDKYFGTAEEKIAESQELLKEGQRDNTKGDSYNLVSVIYSLVLFLLGIVGIFKTLPNRVVVMIIAAAFLIFAFIYMCTIPLPTGFDQMNFFEFNK
ncbi:MAG: hypothetical protein IJ598_06565 [Ruminococcus sp.]|nr:hypothetical protein [Ruminococcus sp.]